MRQKPWITRMFYLFPAAMLLLGRGSAIATADDLPQPNVYGDYVARTGHRLWVVVDPDPRGVNCRWSSAMPANWYEPGANLPPANIYQWSVVRSFKRNSVLKSNITPAGFALMFDTRNKPWLKVGVGSKEQICLVRANSKFIQPFQK
ncbi:MAG: hypothetical protein WCA35_13795 [Kovacikia sp.]